MHEALLRRRERRADRLIAELIDDGSRIVDIPDVLGLSRRAVELAQDRARAD
jgi:hypothetical protein